MRNPAKNGSIHSSAFAAAVVVGIIAGLYFMRGILIPLAFALTLTFLLTPLVTLLQRLRLGRVAAVILALVFAITTAGYAGWIIGNQLIDVINQLPTYRKNIHNKIQSLSLTQKGPLGRAATSVKEIGQELSTTETPPAAGAPPHQKRNALPTVQAPLPVQMVQPAAGGFIYFREWSTSLLRWLAAIGIVIIFTIFMLVKREDLRNRLLRLAGLSQLSVMTQALDDAAKRVSRYLLMQFFVNTGFGIVIATGLYFIGLPTPALWGVLGAILRMVPYAGTLIAGGVPLVLALAVFNGWAHPLLVLLLFVSVELLVGNFLEPWLYGTHTGISSLALLVATVFWTTLWGPAGLVLSTPLTVCVVVLGRYFPELSFLHIILGDEPVLSAEAQLYQRLLAMDQQEARTVVDLVLKDKPLIELYDAVLMPALNMAEQDRHKGAIDVTREEFLFLSVNELVSEFSDYEPADTPLDEGGNGTGPKVSQNRDRRILCLPAHDEADEIAAAILAQILEQAGYAVIAFPRNPSLQDSVGTMDVGPRDIICISAMPPYAFAPARAMWKQLRARFRDSTMLVCVWGFAGDVEKAKLRFERPQPDYLVTSISQTLELINTLNQPGGATVMTAAESS